MINKRTSAQQLAKWKAKRKPWWTTLRPREGPFDFYDRELTLYERPQHYYGETFEQHYVMPLTEARDSDALAVSNHEVGLEMLGGESECVKVQRASHWAVGWVDQIYVKRAIECQDTLTAAVDIVNALENYPVLNDEHYYEIRREMGEEEWD